MGDVDTSVIDVRTSEDDILLANSIALLRIFAPVKPGEVHDLATSVCKVCHYTFLAGTHLEGFETQDVSLDLHKRHVAIQFADAVETTSIHMLIRVILQQVAIRQNAQLFVEHLLPRGANTWQELYVLLQQWRHPISTSAILRS